MDHSVILPQKSQEVSVIGHFALVGFGQPVSQLDEIGLLRDGELTQESLDVFRIQFRGGFRRQTRRRQSLTTINI